MAEKKDKVLVVDEEDIRNLLSRILQLWGYEVTTAANGKEALYQLSLGKANIILLDIRMPEMSGLQVLQKLSDDIYDYCVLMVTGIADVQTAVDALKMGAYDYITKPFSQDEVKTKITTAIGKWQRLTQEKRRYTALQKNITEQTRRMQEQFEELVSSLAREHRLLWQIAARQRDGGKSLLATLPKELQQPISSAAEFREALLRILKRK